jgi:F-type H+-transporting ATPase subunit delta
LETPSVTGEQKCDITFQILKDKICDLTRALIKLVMENNRETYIPGIARNYVAIYKTHKGIKTASLVTAATVDESTRHRLMDMVRKALNADVDLSASVDESVLGGFILTIEDQQYDASVASNLKKIKKQLLETSVIKN